ncbi:hypothetical protein FRC08_018146 [Ceratobasidium sp. 394]|nr:hypothetical protein FRC08_018146 [Ceratobasidium sp. 394]
MFPSRVLSVLLVVSAVVHASPVVSRDSNPDKLDSYTSGFLKKLHGLGLTTPADLLKDAINSPGGDYLVDTFKSQSVTFIVPDNSAFDSDHPSIGDDPVSVFSYSTVYGTPEDGFKITNTSLTRKGASQSRSSASSGLKWPGRSSRKRWNGLLDNNQVQIIDQFSSTSKKRWDNKGPTIIIDRPQDSATVVSRSSYKNIVILVIKVILALPPKVSDLLCKPLVSSAPNGFTEFGGALQRAGLLDYVDNGFKSTVFVPTDQAFYDANLSGDEITSILKNHFFFGKVVYSTLFTSISEATAESGKELYFSYEDGVHYVSCGSDKAIILRSDVTSKWGVMHIIDKPLKCYS